MSGFAEVMTPTKNLDPVLKERLKKEKSVLEEMKEYQEIEKQMFQWSEIQWSEIRWSEIHSVSFLQSDPAIISKRKWEWNLKRKNSNFEVSLVNQSNSKEKEMMKETEFDSLIGRNLPWISH